MLGSTKNNRLNRSCLVYEPWSSYISYVFHGAVKACGNPQCLQPLLNVTRFGPWRHILWWGRLLEQGEWGRDGRGGGEERRKERGRKLEVKAKCLKCNRTQLFQLGRGLKGHQRERSVSPVWMFWIFTSLQETVYLHSTGSPNYKVNMCDDFCF